MPVHVGVPWPTREEAVACPRGDIRLHACAACDHVFNAAFDPQRVTYEPSYDNALDHSSRFRAYSSALANRLIEAYALRGKRIVEIGCGNGAFLLQLCHPPGTEGLGFDPSYTPRSIPDHLAGRVQFVPELFTGQDASKGAHFVCCRHVLEHIDAPASLLTLVRAALAGQPHSAAYFEVPNLAFILRDRSVWDVIYEHVSYFSESSLIHLFERSGFKVLRADEAYNGQFLGIEVAPSDAPALPDAHASMEASAPSTPRGTARSAPSHASGSGTRPASPLQREARAFASTVRALQARWQRHVEDLVGAEQKVVLWGAGSKAVSFSNMLSLGEAAPYVVDINPNKQGAYLAGTGQHIIGPDFLRTYQPGAIIVMNPIYAEEIRRTVSTLGLSPTYLFAS